MQACSYASYAVRIHWEGEVELHSFFTSVSGQSHVAAALPLEIEPSVDTRVQTSGGLLFHNGGCSVL
jgi:hypothetical protein